MRLGNGLVSRSFYVGRNLACFSYRNLRNRAEFIRAVKPEMRLKLDGAWYEVGGLVGQPERSYLVEAWLKDMKSSPNTFRFTGLTTGQPVERYPWKPKFNAPARALAAQGAEGFDALRAARGGRRLATRTSN